MATLIERDRDGDAESPQVVFTSPPRTTGGSRPASAPPAAALSLTLDGRALRLGRGRNDASLPSAAASAAAMAAQLKLLLMGETIDVAEGVWLPWLSGKLHLPVVRSSPPASVESSRLRIVASTRLVLQWEEVAAVAAAADSNALGPPSLAHLAAASPWKTPVRAATSTHSSEQTANRVGDSHRIGGDSTPAAPSPPLAPLAALACDDHGVGDWNLNLRRPSLRHDSAAAVAGLDVPLTLLFNLIVTPLAHAAGAAALRVLPPRGVLIHGPSGTGKTSIVHALCDAAAATVPGLRVRLFAVRGPEVLSPVIGESEARLRRLFMAASSCSNNCSGSASGPSLSIIFFDEVDALCARRSSAGERGGGGGGTASRVVTQLLTLMDGTAAAEAAPTVGGVGGGDSAVHAVVVVGATNRPDALDPALRRPGRFDREVELRPPSVPDRLAILRLHVVRGGVPLAPDGEAFQPELAAACVGFTGADLAALVRDAESRARGSESPSSLPAGSPAPPTAPVLCLRRTDLRDALRHCERASLLRSDSEYDDGGAGGACGGGSSEHDGALASASSGGGGDSWDSGDALWASVGGMASTITALREAVERPLRHPLAYRAMGVSIPRGILLYGPPGNSKTTLVRLLARATNAAFSSLSGAAVYSPFLGDAERRIREAFARARLAAPSLLFLDEIDALVGSRGIGGGGGQARDVSTGVLATLLTEMDGVQAAEGVLVVAATNRPEVLDPALLRPGRLEMHIRVPAPDEAGRAEVLAVHAARLPQAGDVSLAALAAATPGWSGAALENLCREAAMAAVRRIGVAVVGRVGPGEDGEGGAVSVGLADWEGALRRLQAAHAIEV